MNYNHKLLLNQVILILITVFIIAFILGVWFSYRNEIKIEPREIESRLQSIQNNSLLPASYLPDKGQVLGSLIATEDKAVRILSKEEQISIIQNRYPEKAKLLICMDKEESTFGKNMLGDDGLAYGYFQIHIDKHPVLEECAMDFVCSLDFTADMIERGYGFKWTTYKNCLNNL